MKERVVYLGLMVSGGWESIMVQEQEGDGTYLQPQTLDSTDAGLGYDSRSPPPVTHFPRVKTPSTQAVVRTGSSTSRPSGQEMAPGRMQDKQQTQYSVQRSGISRVTTPSFLSSHGACMLVKLKEAQHQFWRQGGFKGNSHCLVVLPGWHAGLKLEEKPELWVFL